MTTWWAVTKRKFFRLFCDRAVERGARGSADDEHGVLTEPLLRPEREQPPEVVDVSSASDLHTEQRSDLAHRQGRPPAGHDRQRTVLQGYPRRGRWRSRLAGVGGSAGRAVRGSTIHSSAVLENSNSSGTWLSVSFVCQHVALGCIRATKGIRDGCPLHDTIVPPRQGNKSLELHWAHAGKGIVHPASLAGMPNMATLDARSASRGSAYNELTREVVGSCDPARPHGSALYLKWISAGEAET